MIQDSPPDPSQRPSSRLEDEVLEILASANRPPSNIVKFKSRARRLRFARMSSLMNMRARVRVTEVTLLGACVALATLAAILSGTSPILGKVLAVGSVAALFALFWNAWGSGSTRPPTTKVWRGRDIALRPPPGQDFLDRIRARTRRPRR